MNVPYVAEALIASHRNGQVIRREGLLAALAEAGHDVTLIEVPTKRGRAGFVGALPRSQALRIAESLEGRGLVVVEGLPLHRLVRHIPGDVNVLWELCDSWPLKYVSALRASHAVREATSALAAWWCLGSGALGRRNVSLLHISRRDSRVDATLLFRRGGLVIPNGVTAIDVRGTGDRSQVIMLGDWEYGPNRRAYDWLRSLVGEAVPSRVAVYGHGATDLPSASWVDRVGFAGDLAPVFASTRLVLAPVVDGAGVKNKVLEPAAAGIPVVTTREGARGLEVPPWVAVCRDAAEFLHRWEDWAATPPHVSPELLTRFQKDNSWAAAVETFRSLDAAVAP